MVDNYGMFTQAGNRLVQEMVNDVLRFPLFTKDQVIYDYLTKRMDIIKKNHPEVWDTEVRNYIITAIEVATNKWLTRYW